MAKKFELTNETIEFDGRTLYRIKALNDFSTVKAGDLGGFVEKESNLSQEGNCWIHSDAKVFSNAMICNNAVIYDNAVICNNAIVYDDATVCEDAIVRDNAKVYNNAIIYNDAGIYGDAEIYGNAVVRDNAKVYNNAVICDNARISDNAKVYNHAKVYDDAIIYGNAVVFCNAIVCDNARVRGNVEVGGNAEIYNNAVICDNAMVYGDAKVFGNALVCDDARVCGNTKIYDDAEVYGSVKICDNAILKENQVVRTGYCRVDLSKNLKENIRCQTNLFPQKDCVIAYKQVNKDLTSLYDNTFQYKINEWVEVENPDMSNAACTTGLHFSNMNYWDRVSGGNTTYLMAKIMLDDIITVQRGKIRCKRAFIIDKYEIEN